MIQIPLRGLWSNSNLGLAKPEEPDWKLVVPDWEVEPAPLHLSPALAYNHLQRVLIRGTARVNEAFTPCSFFRCGNHWL